LLVQIFREPLEEIGTRFPRIIVPIRLLLLIPETRKFSLAVIVNKLLTLVKDEAHREPLNDLIDEYWLNNYIQYASDFSSGLCAIEYRFSPLNAIALYTRRVVDERAIELLNEIDDRLCPGVDKAKENSGKMESKSIPCVI
jgi:hypothetical protein